MRDIRDDLLVRRSVLIGRYGDVMHQYQIDIERLHRQHREAVDAFEAEKATLDAMIVMEERRVLGSAESAPLPVLSLRDFIIGKVEADGPIDKDQLRSETVAAGYGDNGRTFNMTLQNIVNGGRVAKLADGRFVASSASNLFGLAGSTREASMTAM